MVNMRFIDLNSKFIEIGDFQSFGKEPRDEFWQNDFRSTDGFHSFRLSISLLSRTIQRPLQSQKFFLLDQFFTLAFAQLTFRESLRDIEACLRTTPEKLYHMGIRSTVSRNTWANANQVRNWRIYADFAQILIQEARSLYQGESFGLELDHTVYALDATTIDLCLSLFPWAQFRRRKSAVKLHTLLDLRGSIPSVVIVTVAVR